MTKTIILKSPECNEATEKKLKSIEFHKAMNRIGNCWKNPTKLPSEWKYIELISKNISTEGYNLMFAYNDDRNYGVLYLGKWNDGVVE